MKMQCLVSVAAALLATVSHAEILQGIEPLDTLGDIKKKFPNAQVLPVKAAWVKEDQAFYSLEGVGLPGKIRLAFDDSRPSWRTSYASLQKNIAEKAAPTQLDKEMLDYQHYQSNQGDDTGLTINWVRWIPENPIPIERYKSKYGQPTECGFSDGDLTPFCRWKEKALYATLSDDKKTVFQVDTSFTRDEYKKAYTQRFGWLPDWLKDPVDTSPKAASGVAIKRSSAKK